MKRNSLLIPLTVSLAIHGAVLGLAELSGIGRGWTEGESATRVEYSPEEPAGEAAQGTDPDESVVEAIALETDDPRFRPYLQRVRKEIAAHWQEPRIGAGEPDKGSLTVEFTIQGTGNLLAVSVTRSSGGRGLDFAAVEAVKKAAPFEPFPPSMGSGDVTVRALFVYD